MKKILFVLTVAAIVALSATVSFAATTVNLESYGVLNAGALVSRANAAGLSFVVNDNLTLAVGAGIENISKPSETGDLISATTLIAGGYYKIMEKGSVSQSLGLELGYLSQNVKEGDNPATYMDINGIYRVAVKLFPALTMNFDVEVVKITSDVTATNDTGVTNATTTLLNGVRIGFTVPVM